MPPEQVDSPQLLQEKLAEVFVKWPLYRFYVYLAGACHPTDNYAVGTTPYGLMPQLKLFCNDEKCRYETLWEPEDWRVYFNSTFIRQKKYTCRNCGRNTVHYCFVWQDRKSDYIFGKVGQYPELEERVPKNLEEALSATDLKLYKNALRLRNFNLGVAAVAYMRRVIENRMTEILEILHEAAITHNIPSEILARHEEMKREKRFSLKVDYAGELLPAGLRPPGKPNPMAILHDLASDGLHAKSDEECVDIFDACRRTFEYVFGKLRIETEDAKNFIREMTGLAEKKSKGMTELGAAQRPSGTDAPATK